MSIPPKVRKNIFFSIAFGGLLYLGLTIYADYTQVTYALSKFSWYLFPVLLALSFINYISRFMKWDYYLRLLNIPLKKSDSFSVFMSGLIMSVTPGKMGELLKSYLVKQISGTPISVSAPVVFAERITDFISLVLIGLAGAYSYNYGQNIVLIVAAFFITLVVLIGNRKTALGIIAFFGRISFLKKHTTKMLAAYESSYTMLRLKPLLLMTLLSLASWSFECLGYFIILRNFHVDVSLLWASFNYAFGTIVGAITMLPGGLGVTEGSLTVLLIQLKTPPEIAVASTFIIRIVTLWFAVFVGVISVTLYQKRFGQITEEHLDKPE